MDACSEEILFSCALCIGKSVNLGFTALENFGKGQDAERNGDHTKILLRCLFIQHT